MKDKANYCLQCKNSPCRTGCPLSNNIPEFIKLFREDNIKEAYNTLLETTCLSSICGRICPHEVQCQSKCIRGYKGDPVSIGEIESTIGDIAIKENYPIPVKESIGKKIAIIGGGPAGLTCAFFLKVNGFDVTIYEKHNYLGGLLSHGIPEFRLDRDILNKTIDRIINLGINVKYNMELGNNLTLDELNEFDAIVITIGANLSNKMNIPGEDLFNVIPGNEFLEEKQVLDLTNKKVIVSGGGNVAIDVARTAKRMGGDVTIVYRRDEASMPANRVEIAEAKKEGVNFLLQTNILEVIGDNNVSNIKVIKTELIHEEGRRPRPVNIEGTEYYIPCDYIFMAIGSHPDDLVNSLNLELDNGYIKHDESGLTSNPKIYTAGDIAYDNNTVAYAASAGRKVAFSIIDRFNNKKA